MASGLLLFTFLFISTFMSSVVGQELPSISEIIWPDIKRLGMIGYLNCTVSRQKDNKVFWMHRDNQMILTSDDRVQVDEKINEVVDGYPKYDVVKRIRGDKNTYMLVIRRLILSDSGTYTCLVVVRGAQQNPSKDGQLIVLVPPTIIQARTTQTMTVTEGDSFNITCDASGNPTPNVSWVRVNGHTLPPPYNDYMTRGNRLQLINIRGTDRGMYRCVADNNVRPLARFDTTIWVNFKPAPRPLQSSYGQAQNRLFQLTIDCIMAGYPPPAMQWYKVVGNGQTPIIDDDKHVINQMLSHGQQLSISEVWYQLTIINVQGNDYGYYICEGTNRLGKSQYKIQVYETSECQGANCPQEGGTFRSDCSRLGSTKSLLQTISIGFCFFWFSQQRSIYKDV